MTQAENKLRWCLKKAENEGIKHRGLRQVQTDESTVKEHIQKAEHNLTVMQYLVKGNYDDWAVHASFYAHYHCLLAILQKHMYESRNQECTFAAIEYLIEQGKISLTKNELHTIFATDKRDKLETTDIVELRERFQYGTETHFDTDKIRELSEKTKTFIERTKAILQS